MRNLALHTASDSAPPSAAIVAVDDPHDAHLVPHCFARAVAANPEATAVACEQRAYSYRELDERSAALASKLRSQGVGPGVTVGVCLQPTAEVAVALLGLLRAGAAYLPIDPSYPQSFIATIVGEAAPALIITEGELAGCLPADVAKMELDVLDVLAAAAPWRGAPVAPSAEDPAYVIFTSGTTGTPKGVVATHGNLAHYLRVARQRYRFGPEDVFLSLARHTFSISLFELLSPLCSGGKLLLLPREDVLSPERLACQLERATVIHAGPSLLSNLFRFLRSSPAAPDSFPSIRHASTGGDLVSPRVMEGMKAVFNEAELYVIYGCTEISCMGLTFPIPRDRQVAHSFVGQPFQNVGVRLLNEAGEDVPAGDTGELFCSGEGITQGYLHRPDLTRERYRGLDGERFYQTGDLGRRHDDGNIEILGRRDFQVQLRGMRIELPSIEHAIEEAGLAEQCAVILRSCGDDDERLVAFVVEPSAEPAAVARALTERLPSYMVPQSVVPLDALPLTPNGKVDRRALQTLRVSRPSVGAGNAGDLTTIQRQVASAFAEVLDVEDGHIGPDDDFFELGGHSLLAFVLSREIEDRLGTSVSAGALFENTTVRAVAALATGQARTGPRPIPLSSDMTQPPIHMLAGVHIYRDLAALLEGRYSTYGVYVARELEMFEEMRQGGALPSLATLAREYVATIVHHQPHGPYRLAGMSFGGVVAYEVAQQLMDRGERVDFVGLIDSDLPQPAWRRHSRRLRQFLTMPAGRSLLMMQRKAAELVDQHVAGGPRRRYAEFVRHDEDEHEQVATMEDMRQEAYARIARTYSARARTARCPVALVTSGRRLRRHPLDDPKCGWSHLARELAVTPVDANHRELVEPPHVEQVARAFSRSLEKTTPPTSADSLP